MAYSQRILLTKAKEPVAPSRSAVTRVSTGTALADIAEKEVSSERNHRGYCDAFSSAQVADVKSIRCHRCQYVGGRKRTGVGLLNEAPYVHIPTWRDYPLLTLRHVRGHPNTPSIMHTVELCAGTEVLLTLVLYQDA
jgi:hypothetical protein